MKSTKTALITFLLVAGLSGFKTVNEINNCFINFTTANRLTAAAPDRLPESAEKFRSVKTENGELQVSVVDGYRVLYNNKKKAPFVNLKIELSDPELYERDKEKIIDHLKYLNAHSSGMETKDLVELNYNGFKISGLSRGNIEAGSTLGIFVMFPGNGVTVYFYFNNLKPEVRNFESVADYKSQRNEFIGEYTSHLVSCAKQ